MFDREERNLRSNDSPGGEARGDREPSSPDPTADPRRRMPQTEPDVRESLDLTIPGELQLVGSVRRFLINVLRTLEVEEATRDEVGLVLTELCNNSIEHGAETHNAKHPLSIRLAWSPKELRLRISGHHRTGLDAARLQDAFRSARLGEDKFSERGRGLFLVATLMDDVKVEADPRDGLVVDTVRYLDGRRGSGSRPS
jgi:anti-sigma regulatory factor (Ser/Thr protein kinase)